MRRLPMMFALMTLAGAPQIAAAQADDAGDYDQLVHLAIAEFDAGRWSEARVYFRRAHGLNPNARTLRGIGFASFELGDYVEAIRALDDALDDARRPLTDAQRAEAEAILGRALSFVARVSLTVSPRAARVSIDGVPALFRDGALVLNPGLRELTIEAEGYEPFARRIYAEGGSGEALDVALHPLEQPGALGETAPADRHESSGGPSWRAPLGWTLVSVGAASAIVSVATGVRADMLHRDLEMQCPDGRCPAELAGDVDRGSALVRSSTWLMGAAVATGVTGTVLLLVERGRRRSRASIEPGPGVVGISVRGWF